MSETRTVLGSSLVRKVASVPVFAGRDAGEGRAKGGQQLNRAEPAALERSKRCVKSSGPVKPETWPPRRPVVVTLVRRMVVKP